MSERQGRSAFWMEPGAREYVLVCTTALGMLLLVLWQRDLGLWCLFPPAVGLLALGFRWRVGPVLLLAVLGALLLMDWIAHRRRYSLWEDEGGFRLDDFL